MSVADNEKTASLLVLEYDLDASPQKVWRALSIAEFRKDWLPQTALSDGEAHNITPEQQVSYRMRESTPPFLESVVTFQIAPNTFGGTSLKIIHTLDNARLSRITNAANTNGLPVMSAA